MAAAAAAVPDVCTVLVVEDDPDGRETLTRFLNSAGCTVTATHSVGEALLILEEWDPSHILLDLMLPDAGGGVILLRLPPQHTGARGADHRCPTRVGHSAGSAAPRRGLLQAAEVRSNPRVARAAVIPAQEQLGGWRMLRTHTFILWPKTVFSLTQLRSCGRSAKVFRAPGPT